MHIASFEACSDFTHVTARWIAQPSKDGLYHEAPIRQLPSEPLVSYQINRQLSGWKLPPLLIRAFAGALQSFA